jgi:rhodanese-related sulfurtransferase
MGRKVCDTLDIVGQRLMRAVAIVVFGSTLGLAWNSLSGRGFALSRNVFIKEGDEVIEAGEAKKRLDKGALFLDARPEVFYKMAHVPGALPLPEDDFEKAFTRIEPRLRSTFDLVVYCSGFGCEASHIVAKKLKERGIQAAILHEGWPAWEEARYPVREGAEP